MTEPGPTELPALPRSRFGWVLGEATALGPRTVALRRRLHRAPELGLDLPLTRELVLEDLADLPLEIKLSESTSAITATLHGDRPGPAVLLRADMDALPLHEESGVEFSSGTDGVMHACGHDAHTAMLASAARLLAAHTDRLAGSVVLMFQPGEEGFHGARHMIHEGVLDAAGERVQRAFGLHVHAGLPTGTITTRPGPIMAAADRFTVRIVGRGGHGSLPHNAVDPIPAAAELVGALQTVITRRVSAFEPTVLSVCRITSGTTSNIIPEDAELEGTIRTLSDPTRALIRAEIAKVAEHVAAAHGCRAEVDVEPGYSATVNDDEVAADVLALAEELLGEDYVEQMPVPIMGAEDFSYVLQRVPGAFAFLGACPPELDPAVAPSNHSNRVVFDEDSFPHGVALYAAFALSALQ